MRKLLAAALLVLLLPGVALCQVIPGGGSTTILDEGIAQGSVRSINCVGAGIACTAAAGLATVTALGGAGSSNVVEVSINLGTSKGLVFQVTVTGQAWVGLTSVIVCSPFATSADGQTIETYYAAGFVVQASTRVALTGFDLGVYSPHGATGTFRFHCTGA